MVALTECCYNCKRINTSDGTDLVCYGRFTKKILKRMTIDESLNSSCDKYDEDNCEPDPYD